jgi:hypothetical protein
MEDTLLEVRRDTRMRPVNQLIASGLVALCSCSKQQAVPAAIDNRSEATLSNVLVVGSTFTNRVATILPHQKCDSLRLLRAPGGGLTYHFTCDVGGRKLSHGHDDLSGPFINVTIEVLTNLEVTCGLGMPSVRLH